MIDALAAAVASLAARLRNLEALPFNPYSPDADLFDHFSGDGTIDARWSTTLVLTGTVSLPDASPTYVRLSSGATAASTAQLDWGSREALVGPSKACDIRWRARYPLAVDGNTRAEFRLMVTGLVRGLVLGVIGSVSAAFFVARTIGVGTTDTTTTVPIDTAWHDFRIQSMPTAIRYYIDNVMVAEHTTNIPVDTAYQPTFLAQNGATAADRQLDVDLVWIRESR